MLEIFKETDGAMQPLGMARPEVPMSGFQEEGSYAIRCPDSRALLYVDDRPADAASGDAFWKWKPRFYAGRVEAELVLPHKPAATRFLFDVSPDGRKLAPGQFEQFLHDIAESIPEYLLGSEPGRIGAGGAASLLTVWMAYARFKAHAETYARLLQNLADRPMTRLRRQREMVDIQHAKRIDAATVRGLLANPGLLQALSADMKADAEALPVTDARVNAPFHEMSADNPPNRLMLKQLRQVLRHSAWVSERLQGHQDAESEAATPAQPALHRRLSLLDKVRRELRTIAGKQPFAAMPASDSRAGGLNAVTSDPLYNQTYQKGLAILKRGTAGLADDESLYLSATWRLYEAWCFCVLADALESAFNSFQWKRHMDNAGRPFAGCMVEGRRDDCRIRLFEQLSFPPLEKANRHGYASISKQRRPDMVLECRTPEATEFVCIDAKYRAGRQHLLDAMESAHIYQQSLKLDGQPPLASCLLAPHTREAPRLSAPDYWARYQVACLPLAERSQVKPALSALMTKLTHLRLNPEDEQAGAQLP